MIGDEVAALQFQLGPGEALPGTEEQFESALRPATVARLSIRATVRASLVLPYALDVRIEPLVGGSSAAQTQVSDTSAAPPHVSDTSAAPPPAATRRPGAGSPPTQAATAATAADTGTATGRPRELAVVVSNDPDSPVPYLRVAFKGVALARVLPTVDDDLTIEFDPGEYFLEFRRGGSWAEVEHPVPLNRVSYFGERQAANAAAAAAGAEA